MRQLRNGAAALALALGLTATQGLVAARADAAEIKRSTERTFDFAPGGTLKIQNENGRVIVEAWDQPRVRVQITRVVRAKDVERAEAYMHDLRAEINLGRDKLEIISRRPKRRESIGFWDLIGQRVASAQIHYYVLAPRETRLELVSANGPVRARGTHGAVQVSTTNGGIEVEQVTGRVEAQTTNGSIELSNIEGTASAGTTNGSVTAVLRKIIGPSGIDFHTTNGGIEIYLPDALRATLEAQTTNGKVNVSYPLTTQGVMTSKSIRGTIGGGGMNISLLTTNGNIDVRRLSERGSAD
jgi:DUF4097 and DUF4098 domain-containing protein YvlB